MAKSKRVGQARMKKNKKNGVKREKIVKQNYEVLARLHNTWYYIEK